MGPLESLGLILAKEYCTQRIKDFEEFGFCAFFSNVRSELFMNWDTEIVQNSAKF